jgi:predicted CoA-binding protein
MTEWARSGPTRRDEPITAADTLIWMSRWSKRLLTRPATWAVVGLSANTERTAYSIGQYLRDRLGLSIVSVKSSPAKTAGGWNGA